MGKLLLLIVLLFSFNNSYSQHKKEEAPKPLNLSTVSKLIQYPDSAKVNRIEGRVVVKLLVDANGEVERISDQIEGPEVFHEEITRVSWFLKFTPAKIDGENVKCWISVPFKFKLSIPEEQNE